MNESMARYDRERIIGSGTFGNVWLVRSKLTRQTFVLKEINLKSLSEAEQRQALTEAEVLSKCKHRHIIRHKEAIIDENKYLLIVMEHAEGGDLYSAIDGRNGAFFPDHRIITWFIQICLALQYIHFKNILHRDLKSQNIFLTLNNVIKIGDFGIARLLQEPEELAKTAIGTPYYLSPEIFQRKPYNHKSDIWALGCVLFEMAALEHAFKASDFFQLANAVLCGRRRELPRKCSPIIRELVRKLLKTDPEERPSTCEILKFPALQPYLSEYMTTQAPRENFLPVLTGQTEKIPKGSTGISPIEDNGKRRSSIGSANLKIPKRENFLSKERMKARAHSNIRSLSNKNFQKPSALVFSSKWKREFPGACNAANESFGFKISRQEKQDFIVSRDTYVLPTTNHKTRPKASSQLSESEDSSLSAFSRYRDETSHHSDSECDISYHDTFSGSTNKLAAAEGHVASNSCTMLENDRDDVFDFAECATNTMTNKSDFSYHQCHHFQCHQCMLDTLWKNRIRYCVGVSVDKTEYQRLKNKLLLVYQNELFRKVYKSLIFDWDGKEDSSKKTKFQALMNSLKFDQVQTLPLMLQFIQLDLLQSRKGAN